MTRKATRKSITPTPANTAAIRKPIARRYTKKPKASTAIHPTPTDAPAPRTGTRFRLVKRFERVKSPECWPTDPTAPKRIVLRLVNKFERIQDPIAAPTTATLPRNWINPYANMNTGDGDDLSMTSDDNDLTDEEVHAIKECIVLTNGTLLPVG